MFYSPYRALTPGSWQRQEGCHLGAGKGCAATPEPQLGLPVCAYGKGWDSVRSIILMLAGRVLSHFNSHPVPSSPLCFLPFHSSCKFQKQQWKKWKQKGNWPWKKKRNIQITWMKHEITLHSGLPNILISSYLKFSQLTVGRSVSSCLKKTWNSKNYLIPFSLPLHMQYPEFLP